jgi:hypothetical protein
MQNFNRKTSKRLGVFGEEYYILGPKWLPYVYSVRVLHSAAPCQTYGNTVISRFQKAGDFLGGQDTPGQT